MEIYVKNDQIRDEWPKSIKSKFKSIVEKRRVADYEKKIVGEMEKGGDKCFNDEGKSYARHKFLGVREALRGAVVKE